MRRGYRSSPTWPTFRRLLVYLRGLGFLSRQWRGFKASYDKQEVLAGSDPRMTVFAAGGELVVLGVMGYVPSIAKAADFQRPWLPLVFAALGGLLTQTVHERKAEGDLANVATLFDNVCYSAALAFAACSTRGGYALGLAVSYGFLVIAFPGTTYALTLPFALAMALPLAAAFAIRLPEPSVGVILVCSYVLMLVWAAWSARRRALLAAQEKLTQAVGAASAVADDSVQAALSTTLLTLGNFLHELRNHQTTVRSNLAYIEMQADLDQNAREALADAVHAQEAEELLVRETLAELKGRARPAQAPFAVGEFLADVIETGGHTAELSPPEAPFEIAGDAKQLEGVLTNLLRNAEQAGARRIVVDARIEASGHAVLITVHDDGPGIPEEHWEALFEPFGHSTKAAGTGLGLYLCRRYVELFGGLISVGKGPLGGASFSIRLPGSLPTMDADEDAPPSDRDGSKDRRPSLSIVDA
jgi:signal transduction histidine kinase